MASSLQDQLLKAGLADQKQAKQIKQKKRKQDKIARTQKKVVENESKTAVANQLEEKRKRDQALNQEQKLEAEKKSITHQIKQLITMNVVENWQGELAFNFTDGNKIRRLLVAPVVQQHLQRGKYAITRLGDDYAIVPMGVAMKIQERDESAGFVVYQADDNDNKQNPATSDEDDWYADFEVPDDLMW